MAQSKRWRLTTLHGAIIVSLAVPRRPADGAIRRSRALQPDLPGHAARGDPGQRQDDRAGGAGAGDRTGQPGRRRRSGGRPCHLAAAAGGDDRDSATRWRTRASRSSACRKSSSSCWRRSAARSRCCRRPTRRASRQAGRTSARGAAPPVAATAGRDRKARQRRERAAEEALHQPVHARGRLRDLLRRPAAQDRGARHARLPRAERQEAVWRADDEHHRRCRRPRRRGRHRAPSTSRLLDRRAMAIVRAASPFGRFTADMRKQADQIVVTSRFRFTRDDGLETTRATRANGRSR